jgi:hypothetical protein
LSTSRAACATGWPPNAPIPAADASWRVGLTARSRVSANGAKESFDVRCEGLLPPRADPRHEHHFRSHPLPARSGPELKDGRGWCHAGCQKIIAARAAAGDRNTFPVGAARNTLRPRRAERSTHHPARAGQYTHVLRRAKRSTHIHPAPRRYSKCRPGRRSTSPADCTRLRDRGNLNRLVRL